MVTQGDTSQSAISISEQHKEERGSGESPAGQPKLRRPLRLWPAVVIVALQWSIRFGLPLVEPEATGFGVIAGLVGGLALLVWWLFFSRAVWSERLGALVLMIAALLTASRFIHPSIATGMMGMMFPIYAIPVLSLAFVAALVASRRLSDGPRRAAMAVSILLACGSLTLIRTGGFTGYIQQDFAWRWTKTPEERLLAQDGEAAALASVSVIVPAGTGQSEPRWPGFRGPHRDGILRDVRIETDWSASPPVEMWRRPIGPGWSSFAVQGKFFYTQEQRGEDEVVACYTVTTGEPVWAHLDATRFWESNAGAGPRGTPTLSDGRVYTFGATGIFNVLDAYDGSVIWSRNAASDTGAELPDWGFSSSPLVVNDLVLVAASGTLAAYGLDGGEPRWIGPAGGSSYSSPHLMTIAGVAQVMLLSASGATSFGLADGALLWEHLWPGYPIVQPALTADGDILISVSDKSGTRRLAVANEAGVWTVEERWTSNGLKAYFNDFVVHQEHAYGFDGGILACIDIENGKRKWKGGRFGHGQLILLADQNLLLVLSEKGELALVGATPDQFTELSRFPAIKSKTWNHPVLTGDVLLVRNAEEMAAFRLSPQTAQGGSTPGN